MSWATWLLLFCVVLLAIDLFDLVTGWSRHSAERAGELEGSDRDDS